LEDKMGRRTISQGHYDKADSLLGVDSNKRMKEMSEQGTTINYDRPKTDLPTPTPLVESQPFFEIIKSVFTKKGFEEFVAFIKSGFKLKE